MCPAAGTAVRARKARDAHVAFEFFLATVLHLLQFFFRRPKLDKLMVFPDIFICLCFDLQDLFKGNARIIIDRYDILSHVEADIVAVEGAADHAAYDMLTGMLLHMIEAEIPVDNSGNFCSFLYLFLRGNRMPDFALFFLHIKHTDHTSIREFQPAAVSKLSAAFRIKSSLVQDNLYFSIPFPHALNRCGKLFQEHVLIIKFFSHIHPIVAYTVMHHTQIFPSSQGFSF